MSAVSEDEREGRVCWALDRFRPDLPPAERCAAFLALSEREQEPYWAEIAQRAAKEEGRP